MILGSVRQKDGAFKEATQLRVTAPPEGNKFSEILILNAQFQILNYPDNGVFGTLANSITLIE